MWLHQTEPFTSEKIQDSIGFAYRIKNLQNGKIYLGKKGFFRVIKRKGKRTKVESDWQRYWGSNKTLQEDVKTLGSENFQREILHLCQSKGALNYLELKEQVINDVLLFPSKFYNEFVGIKIHRKHVKPLWKDNS